MCETDGDAINVAQVGDELRRPSRLLVAETESPELTAAPREHLPFI